MDEISTARLRWRPIRPEDAETYWPIVSDYEVVKMLGSWPYPPDRAFLEGRCQPFDASKGMVGPVFLGDEHIGGMGVIEGDFGYFLARAHWGKGYATEMGRAMIAVGLQRYDWARLFAGVWVDNPASARVLEKLGFTESGRSRAYCKARAEEIDSRDFALTRADWEARHAD